MKKIVPLVAIIVVIYTIGFFTLKKSDLLNGSQSAAVLKADQAYLKTFDAQKVSSIVSPDGPAMTVGNDLCPNIAGTQNVVPAGYQLVNGQCVVIDVCPNIPGDQATVPAGNTIIGGKCYSVREVNLPVTTKTRPNLGIPVGPVVTTPPTGVCVDPATGQTSTAISYMVGGHDRTHGFADVWSFNAGTNKWSLITNSATFGDKAHHRLAFFKNKIWLMGGVKTTSWNYIASNEIWSFDGSAWVHFDNDSNIVGIQDAPWESRFDFGLTVFNGKLWAMGGTLGVPFWQPSYNDVWSFDGTTWTPFDNKPTVAGYFDAPWATLSLPGLTRTGRTSLESAVFNGNLLITGGLSKSVNDFYLNPQLSMLYSTTVPNDMWSLNGTTWAKIDNAPATPSIIDFVPWPLRQDFVLLPYQNKLWLMGGENIINGQVYNDVWSYDGLNWTNEGNAPWARRGQFAGMVLNGKIYIMGGDDNTNLYNDVWSFDGTTWTQVDNDTAVPGIQNAPWAARDGLAIISCQ